MTGERGDTGNRGVAGERGEKGDHGQQGERGERGRASWIAWVLTTAIVLTLGLSVLAVFQEAKDAEEFAGELREANVTSCERVNVVRSNQRFVLRKQTELYGLVAGISQNPELRDTLRAQIRAMERRRENVGTVACDSEFPSNG